MEKMKKSISDKKDAVKSKVQEIVDYRAQTSNKPIRHVRSSDRNGKRYKNTQSVFSINDDSDLSEDEDVGLNLVASSSNEKVGCFRDILILIL
jgi:hypothetical protein